MRTAIILVAVLLAVAYADQPRLTFPEMQEKIRAIVSLVPPEERNAKIDIGINFLKNGGPVPAQMPAGAMRHYNMLTTEEKSRMADYLATLKTL